jgi:hypothetical protein
MSPPPELAATLLEAESYIEERLFDPYGLLYAYIDIQTGKPFAPGVPTPAMTPVRARFDPWSYWSYEDSICAMGMYVDGQMRKYRVTGEQECLEKAHQVWLTVRNIYYTSQMHGRGTFMRPYGGLRTMEKFLEPLGTDQAGPLFHGLYAYMQQAEPHVKVEIADVLLQTLTWYEQQGFKYIYYKCLLHEWNVEGLHATSYYLPAIAWAAQWTGEAKWKKHLEAKRGLFESDGYCLFRGGQGAFCRGTDLPNFADILGTEFSMFVPPAQLEAAYEACLDNLKCYDEPKTSRRFFEESKEPGFKPYLHPMAEPYARDGGIGFPYYYTVHQGRHHPRHETHFLCALAALGHPGALDKAWELLGIQRDVPRDFTAMIIDDYEALPESVQLCARAVGVGIVEWFRNYWLLRSIKPTEEDST